jgi:opacity protein-like surface antigen
MSRCISILVGAVTALTLLPATARAAHPLITEDTDTLGKNIAQLELTSEHITIRSGGVEQLSVLTTTVLGYGLSDRADLLLTAPYLRIGDVAVLGTPDASGFADLGIDIKWRFYESDRLSFAVKPGMTFPTGNDDLGLGTGRTAWSLYLVSSYQLERWTFLLHLGHIHNNNVFSERVNLWHASTAVTWQATDKLKLIVDAGSYRDPDPDTGTKAVFAVGGLIWSPLENLDLDLGYRTTATDNARLHALLAGLTVRW